MAVFEFEYQGKEKPKPMRSYVDFDANGSPKARVYADEYDAVKSNPDFQPLIAGAGRNMQTAQDDFADEMNEAKIEDVEKRIKRKRQETIRAEAEAREAQAEDNVYSGPDFLGSIGGLRKTFTEKATSRQQELRRMMEERAGYMGTPEISAPMEEAAPVEQAPSTQNEYINLKSPDGSVQRIKKNAWSSSSKTKPGKKVSEVYLDSGYSIVP